jgi:hypothetical protein
MRRPYPSRLTGRSRFVKPPAVFRLLPGGPAASLCARGELAGSYGEALTFTRASGKHAESGSGVQTLLSNNQPGVEPKGLLIEAAATNLILHSAALDNAAWVKAGGVVAAPTVTADAATAPDGNTAAERVQIPSTAAGGSFSRVGQSANLTAASYTFSCWIRGRSGSGSTYLTAFIAATGLNPATVLCNYTTTWQRFSLTFTATAVSWHMMIGTDAVNSATGHTDRGAVDIEVWGAQVELGTFASSYIATAGTSATRVAETASVSSAAFPITAGSIELDYTPSWGGTPAANRVLFDTRKAAATDDGLIAYIDTSRLLNLITDGATTFTLSSAALTWTAGQRYRMRFVWGGGNLYMYRDDVLVASDTSAVRPMPTQHSGTCWLGSDYTGGATAYGHLSNLSVRR